MSIKFLYANGDSFGFGQELDGPRTGEDFFKFSDYQRHHCYSGIIADRLGLEYNNQSMPGGSNQRIYRTTLFDVCELLKIYKPHELFVMLSLTHAQRREFYNVRWAKYYPHMLTCEPASTDAVKSLWRLMVDNFHDDKADLHFDQMNILGLQNFLRINKVPYLMTWSMHHPIVYQDEQQHVAQSVLDQRYHARFYQRPSFAYHVFTELKLQRAVGGHPLADGHAAWADHVLNYINTNDLFNNYDLL